MSYIYKITNCYNDKIYVGKTNQTIEKRWQQHCNDYKRLNKEKRPLYSAMKKYGVEYFSIEKIEECDPELAADRERYWIEYYQSFKKGYNATYGGDGKQYIDYDLVVATYKELQSLTETAEKLKIDKGHISTILNIKKQKVNNSSLVNQMKYGKKVGQYDLQGNFIQFFPSLKAALVSIKGDKYPRSGSSHIAEVCKGKRKTAYGYIWKFIEF